MVYRKGEITAADRERDYPHLCAVEEREGGFGQTILDMHAFCRDRGFSLQRGRRRQWEGTVYCTF